MLPFTLSFLQQHMPQKGLRLFFSEGNSSAWQCGHCSTMLPMWTGSGSSSELVEQAVEASLARRAHL